MQCRIGSVLILLPFRILPFVDFMVIIGSWWHSFLRYVFRSSSACIIHGIHAEYSGLISWHRSMMMRRRAMVGCRQYVSNFSIFTSFTSIRAIASMNTKGIQMHAPILRYRIVSMTSKRGLFSTPIIPNGKTNA